MSVEQTQQTVHDLLARTHSTNRLCKEEMVMAIRQTYQDTSHANVNKLPATSISHALHQDDISEFNRRLLAKLQFIEMDFRYEAIPPAYEKTFEWVFQPPLDSSWSDFTQWLRSDEPLYWISGKPAAGKSTLMKFILNDSRTREYLNEWASGKKLVISSFYFWKSGAPVQMSAEGFARTLLYQTLKQPLK